MKPSFPDEPATIAVIRLGLLLAAAWLAVGLLAAGATQNLLFDGAIKNNRIEILEPEMIG